MILRDAGEAEDAAQEALIAGLGSLERFDRSRPLRPWLVGIVTNKAIDRVRRRDRELRGGDVEEGAHHDLYTGEQPDLRRALEALDAEDRALVVLRYVLDYRSPEIAELLDLPAGTVRSRLKQSLDQLRDLIQKEIP